MERFRRFVGLAVDEERIADRGFLDTLGVRARWIPDPIDEFDEVEVALTLDQERDLVVSATIEKARVARVMFGWGPAGDDDADRRGFTPEELPAVLERHAETVLALFDHWCPA
jgi:hypothetical protein